jgi:3'-phosphoadenosine 5'-phosphosulfate sulfotransferase (PAPS reductase)/FAD synthetase
MRSISWFSCGAASLRATVMTLETYPDTEVVYCRVREEHEDSLRFLADCEKVFGFNVKILEDEKHQGSIFEVFKKQKFIKGTHGAPCTRILKKDLRKSYQKPNDRQVFGYTSEEEDRADRFIDANNGVNAVFPLIDNEITKQDCKNFIIDNGIDLPVMYKLGYQNNNCIGCVKGGMGYWNAIRKDFPEHFQKMAETERLIGHAVLKDDNGAVFLDELDPNRGVFERDLPSDCGFTCQYDMFKGRK